MEFDSDTILNRLTGLAAELNSANLKPQIAACRKMLDPNQPIEVAVLGRFKAGKSSFLNHLIGRDILPIGILPVTAVVTRLRYGASDRAEVRFESGAHREISLSDLSLYTGEKDNTNNVKQVASVEVQLPALEALWPLQLVDTPGLGSAFAHNDEATLNWLPNVGLALVAVSSDAPLSDQDLKLLEQLRCHTPKVVLLLTKADLLSEQQRTEVLSFVKDQLNRKRDSSLPVCFYSVRPNLAGLKTSLEQEVLWPLLKEHEAVSNEILRHKLLSITTQTLNCLRVLLASAATAESARQDLRNTLAKEREQFGLLRSELKMVVGQYSNDLLDRYLVRLEPIQRELQQRITVEMRERFDQWRVRLPLLLKKWRLWLAELLTCNLSEVSHTQRAVFCEPLEEARSHFTRTLRAFEDRIAQHVKAALGIELARPEFVPEVRQLNSPPVDVAYALDVALTTVSWLLPSKVFRKAVERMLVRKGQYEIEKNMSRLAAAWRDIVTEAIEDLSMEIERQALNQLATLEQMIDYTPPNIGALKGVADDLRECQKWLSFERTPLVRRR